MHGRPRATVGRDADMNVAADTLPTIFASSDRPHVERPSSARQGRTGAVPYRPPSSRVPVRPQSASPKQHQRAVRDVGSNGYVGALGLSPRNPRPPQHPPKDHLDFILGVGTTPPLKTTMLQAALTDELEKAVEGPSGIAHKPGSKTLLRDHGMTIDETSKRQARTIVKAVRKDLTSWRQREDAARIVQMYWRLCLDAGSAGRTARARCRMKLRKTSLKMQVVHSVPEPEPEPEDKPEELSSAIVSDSRNDPLDVRATPAQASVTHSVHDGGEYHPDRHDLATACDKVRCHGQT